jgi:hypothetical protein
MTAEWTISLAQMVWLEECGWRLGDDGLWRHPTHAKRNGLSQSRAVILEVRDLTTRESTPEGRAPEVRPRGG